MYIQNCKRGSISRANTDATARKRCGALEYQNHYLKAQMSRSSVAKYCIHRKEMVTSREVTLRNETRLMRRSRGPKSLTGDKKSANGPITSRDRVLDSERSSISLAMVWSEAVENGDEGVGGLKDRMIDAKLEITISH